MPVEKPYSAANKIDEDRAVRRGRALVEIVRSRYASAGDGVKNQTVLRNKIGETFGDSPSAPTLAGDVRWLIDNQWVRKSKVSLKLKKRDSEILADSWCIESLFIAAEIADSGLAVSIEEWNKRVGEFLESKRASQETDWVSRKCSEFLTELKECGYLTNEGTGSHANFGQDAWGKTWFYLAAAREAAQRGRSLRRRFDQRTK